MASSDAKLEDGEGVVGEGEGTGGKHPGLSKRSMAIHIAYVGTGYKGSCVNRALGEGTTIEDLLERAIFKAGLMLESNFGSFSRTRWSRASRTDKGVHSLGTVMGLRMLVDERCYAIRDESGAAVKLLSPADTEALTDPCEARAGDVEGFAMASRINAHLPDNVKVLAVQKANKKFNARHMCADRTYEYYLPASLIGVKGDGSDEDTRAIQQLRAALKLYEGYHPFHNFTAKKAHEADRKSSAAPRPPRERCGQEAAAAKLAANSTAQAGAQGEGQHSGGDQEAGISGGQGVVAGSVATNTHEQVDAEMGQGGGEDGQQQQQQQQVVNVHVEGQEAQKATTPPVEDQLTAAGEGGVDGREGPEVPAGGGGQGASVSGGGGRREGAGGGRRKRDRDARDEEEQEAAESDQDEPGELDDDDDDMLVGFAETGQETEGDAPMGDASKVESAQPAEAEPSQPRRTRARGSLLLKFLDELDPNDVVSKTFYRQIKRFTADDPAPLVQGGTACLRLVVHGQSFMLHHIRHMIGGAVAVTRGLIPMDVLAASLNVPSRVSLPRAPPHTLILSDCSFHQFPHQFGTGDNELVKVTGNCLSLRQGGTARKEAFRKQVLLPALQQLVDLPDWDIWSRAIDAAYPWDPAHVEAFLETNNRWVELMRTKKQERLAARRDAEEAAFDSVLFGSGTQQPPAKRHNPTPQQRQRGRGAGGGRGGGGRGRGRGRG